MRGLRATASDGDRRIAVLFAMIGAAGAIFIPFFAVLLRARGLRPDRIGLVLAASSLASVAAAPLWSHVADDRLGTIRTLRISFVASAGLALGLVPTGRAVAAIVVMAGLLGVAQAPISGLSNALALGHLGPSREIEYGRIRLWTSIG